MRVSSVMNKIERVVFPGSFDPLTNGHTDIVRRSLKIFDTIIVAVLSNPDKITLFTVEERLQLVRDEFKDCGDKVRAISFSGLLVDFLKKIDSRVILRGLRAISDYDYEAQIALMNKSLHEDAETFFLMTSAKSSYISSSLVKQIARFGGDVSDLVPTPVAKALIKKFQK